MSWTQIPGVAEHCRRTGEQPPEGWSMTPADMVAHGGYAVRCGDGRRLGPFAWAENARRVAAKESGACVVRWRAAGLGAAAMEAAR